MLIKPLTSLLEGLKIDLSLKKRDQLIVFINLLTKWNKKFNLTAIKKPEDMLSQHIADSLVALPYVSGEQILDIGSGAGLPGIPLAIAKPQQQFTLLDSNGKKTRFLIQVIAELELENVKIIQERVEQYRPSWQFDQVIARAFGTVNDIIKLSGHLLKAGGEFLLYRGRVVPRELADMGGQIDIIPVQVPKLGKERHLLRIRLK